MRSVIATCVLGTSPELAAMDCVDPCICHLCFTLFLVIFHLSSPPSRSLLSLHNQTECLPGAGIMEADDRQVTTVFTVQPSFHHRHSTKPNIMKRYRRRRTTRWGVTARSPTMVTLHTGWVCRVPMVEWRLDCENCSHLTVVGLHYTGPWSTLRPGGAWSIFLFSQICPLPTLPYLFFFFFLLFFLTSPSFLLFPTCFCLFFCFVGWGRWVGRIQTSAHRLWLAGMGKAMVCPQSMLQPTGRVLACGSTLLTRCNWMSICIYVVGLIFLMILISSRFKTNESITKDAVCIMCSKVWLTTWQKRVGAAAVFDSSGCCLCASCLTSQQHASVSQGRIYSDNFYMLPHWDRSCRSNFPSHPVTVYWHRANQSQHWPYNARRLAL